MAVTASEVFKFKAERQRQTFCEEGLHDEGSLRLFRQKLLGYLTGTSKAIKQETETVQASPWAEFSLDSTRGGHQDPFSGSHVRGSGKVVPVMFSYFGISRLSLLRNMKPFWD